MIAWDRWLRVLKADDLSDLTSLESFSAANSRIGMIPVGFFADNSDLTIIDLAVAQIKSDDEVDGLPAALFDHLTSLTTLRLERNYFMSMPPAFVGNEHGETHRTLDVHDRDGLAEPLAFPNLAYGIGSRVFPPA